MTDFLNAAQSLSQTTMASESLFKKFAAMHYESSHFVACKLLLKSVGFSFFADENGKQLVKLPEHSNSNKLTLISRCLNVLQSKKSARSVLKHTKHIYLFSFVNVRIFATSMGLLLRAGDSFGRPRVSLTFGLSLFFVFGFQM